LSSAACESAWRLTAKQFFGNVFALAANAARCSFCVRTVTAGNATAASPAVARRGSASGVAPIDGTSKALKEGSIIVTASASTGSGVLTRRWKRA
jgi:hypothetical protein